MRRFFSFPNPVNEAAARTVAIGVFTMALLALVSNSAWLLIPLTYGFVARVMSGPTISPLGQFAVRVVAPRLATSSAFAAWTRNVPGPPKRFAQAMGAVITVTATALWVSAGWTTARWFLLPLLVAAALEGFVGYCLGCTIFGWLIRAGVIPESVCRNCGDLSQHYAELQARATH